MSGGLTSEQVSLLAKSLPGYRIVADHSWGLIGTTVLEVAAADRRYIVKAGDGADIHIARETRAHLEWMAPFGQGEVSHLVYGEPSEKLLILEYLPGELVQGSGVEREPWVYESAGALLARFHGQRSVHDDEYPTRLLDRAERWLAAPQSTPHALREAAAHALAAVASNIPTLLVPTHGDYSPRNWLVHDGQVSVIDFGRADLRPAMADLVRLSARCFPERPELENAFMAGYGSDPRELAAWQAITLCEAIGTIGWAHMVGDSGFEAEGLRELERALSMS
ncbi:aminoglycoside phosphotransferase family protein [Demequina sp.]|uniref:aminoglycoside phosphotransferase family protein n=1 Tax=Demequina sp. TaxID=2050685 RepID=UPI003D0CD264